MSDWSHDDDAAYGAAPPASRARPAFPTATLIYVLISLVFAIGFGIWSGAYSRAWGDPAELGIWVSAGSALFVLWVIGVTTYAVLRVSVLVLSVTFRITTRTSRAVFHVLRTPLIVFLLSAFVALAAYGGWMLFLRVSDSGF